ncbi:MAG: hypothetical protein MI924_25385 [Chloroflexales bacterium]|nr:hypothetical protein [Chloroflexales bacterium]
MHQPPVVPHKEGVGGGDGQMVQHLRASFKRHAGHPAVEAIDPPHCITGAQILSGDPAAQQDEEGVLGGRGERIVIEGQGHDHRVQMPPGRGDGIHAGFAGGFVVREDRVADLDRGDGGGPVRRGDGGVRAEATPAVGDAPRRFGRIVRRPDRIRGCVRCLERVDRGGGVEERPRRQPAAGDDGRSLGHCTHVRADLR